MKLPENIGFIGISVAVIVLFLYFILGLSGALSALGIILLFIVPIYFILDNFELGQDEKIVFSFFIGVGVLPAFTYWIGLFISFRLAILISFVVLIAVGILIRKGKKHA
jgi:hypothetical protein